VYAEPHPLIDSQRAALASHLSSLDGAS
jgi:hypothetical protein